MNEVISTMKRRRMTRNFTEEQVTEELLLEIVDAAQHAPSAHMQQAWHFTIVQDEALLNELSNEAKVLGKESPVDVIRKLNSKEDYQVFYNAPTVIIISADKEAFIPESECIAAAQNIFLAAESLGLGACWVSALNPLLEGENASNLRSKLNMGDNQVTQLSISIGHIEKRPEKPYPRKAGKFEFIR